MYFKPKILEIHLRKERYQKWSLSHIPMLPLPCAVKNPGNLVQEKTFPEVGSLSFQGCFSLRLVLCFELSTYSSGNATALSVGK